MIHPSMTLSLKVPTLQFLLIYYTTVCLFTVPKAADIPLKKMIKLSF